MYGYLPEWVKVLRCKSTIYPYKLNVSCTADSTDWMSLFIKYEYMNVVPSKANIFQPATSVNPLNDDALTNITNKIQSVTNSSTSPSIPLALIHTQRYQDFLSPALLRKFQQDPSFISRCLAQLDSVMQAPTETGITKAKCAMLSMLLQGKTLKEVCYHCVIINHQFKVDISIPRIKKLSLMLEYYLVGGLKLLRSFSLHHNSTSFPAPIMHSILTFFEGEKTQNKGKTSGFKINEAIRDKIGMEKILAGVNTSNIPSEKIIDRFIANCGYKKTLQTGWIFEYESSQLNDLPSIEACSDHSPDPQPALENDILPKLISELSVDELEENKKENRKVESVNLSEFFKVLPLDKQKLPANIFTSEADRNFMLEEQALGLNGSKAELTSVMMSLNSLASLQSSLEEVLELIEDESDDSEAFCDFWLQYFQPGSPIPTTIASFENVASLPFESEDISTLAATLNINQDFSPSSHHIASINFSNNTKTQEIEHSSTDSSLSFTAELKTNLKEDNHSESVESPSKKTSKRKHDETQTYHPRKIFKKMAPQKLRLPVAFSNTKISIARAQNKKYIKELNRGINNDAEEAVNKIKFFVVKSLLENKELAVIKTDCEYLFDREKVKCMKLTEKKLSAMMDYYLLGGLTLLRGFAWSLPDTYSAVLMQLGLELIKKDPSQSLSSVHSKICRANQGKFVTPSYCTFTGFVRRCGYHRNDLGINAINEQLLLSQTSSTKKSNLFCDIPARAYAESIKSEEILEIIEQNRELSIKKLATKVGCSMNKIRYTLRKNGYIYENSKWEKRSYSSCEITYKPLNIHTTQ